MLRIRLARRGKKGNPFYRIVVADARSKRDGRYVEQIGYYNPMLDPIEYKIKEGRALHWLSVGAQPSDAVKRLLTAQGTYDRLARVRAGEAIETLANEFDGVELPTEVAAPEVVEAVAAEAEEVVEEAAEVVEAAAEDAAEAVEDAVEAVEEAAETVVAED